MSREFQYYSIILKGCSQRKSLERRLENTLLRGRLAIKMALDSIPSVIIYKGNANSIVPIYEMFKAECAAITILSDGVPPPLPITKKYRDFSKLNSEIQALLTTVPDRLWLGEAIHRIIPATYLDEAGALVLSSHALYFIDKPAGDTSSRWLIIPYGHIIESANLDETNLSISHCSGTGQQSDVFTITPELIASIKGAIEQAKAAKRYMIKLKTFCPVCGEASADYLEHASAEEHCPRCGQSYQRTIIS